MGLTATAKRHSSTIQWTSAVLIVLALFATMRAMPVDRAVAALQGWVDGLGVWGPVVYGAIYVAAALLFVPGAALTLAAGALFGLWVGTLTVSIASTTAAALAFLIARYLARDKVAEQAQKFPRFRAIDRAIGEGGAKVVALLRLSPAVPYSLGNYLFGLTAIRFVPYVLASWLFMLPGTFMYVYFGYIGGKGLKAAATGEGGTSTAEWIALAVGLLATVVVTVYVTRLARQKIAEQTGIESVPETGPEAASEPATEPDAGPSAVRPAIAAVLAVVFVGIAVWAQTHKERLAGLFGPPPVVIAEAYQDAPGGVHFDHSAYDALLKAWVDDRGLVDYEGLGSEVARLDAYLEAIASAPFEDMGRDEKLAFLINAYNAFTLKLILDHMPVDSITDIPGNWTEARWNLAGRKVSLNQIEHEEIRPKFAEPRIHFALVCAAIGCPKLRNEAYVADRLDAQLEDQVRWCHQRPRWLVYDRDAGIVRLTKLYQWYGGDFEQAAGSILGFVRRYVPAIDQDLEAGREIRVEFLDYDWSLNSQANAGRLAAGKPGR